MNLRIIEAEPLGDGIVEMLEAVLVQARADELSSIAIAKVYRDGAMGGEWTRAPSKPALLGSLSYLSFRLNQKVDQA